MAGALCCLGRRGGGDIPVGGAGEPDKVIDHHHVPAGHVWGGVLWLLLVGLRPAGGYLLNWLLQAWSLLTCLRPLFFCLPLSMLGIPATASEAFSNFSGRPSSPMAWFLHRGIFPRVPSPVAWRFSARASGIGYLLCWLLACGRRSPRRPCGS